MHEHILIHWINTPAKLHQAWLDLSPQPWVAIDTEFVRRNTFYPQLALIQMASPSGEVYLFDPLAINDLTPLINLLTHPQLLKVFHSVEQDLEALSRLGDFQVSPIFDTQLAMIALRQGTHMGYARMIRFLLDVELAKDETQSDWIQRPLTSSQQAYAADDVIYLAQAYPLILEKLDDNWKKYLAEDFAQLAYPGVGDDTDKWQKWPFVYQLQPHQRALAECLYAWRQNCALKNDLPKNWLLPDIAIQEWVKNPKYYQHHPYKLPKIKPGVLKHYLDDLLTNLSRCPSQPISTALGFERIHLSPAEEEMFRQLGRQRDKIAEAYGIQPSSQLLTQRELKIWVREKQLPSTLCRGWRGAILQEFLDLPKPLNN